LWGVARDLGLPALSHEATSLATAAAGRSRDETGVVDASVCHGSAGLAHIYHRLHRATGDDAHRSSALGWYAVAVDHAHAGIGSDLSLATGAVGVGLALLAGATDVAPDWDRLLLLDLT
jgi:hypothetical protein